MRLLYVILVFLSPPEPPETPYSDTDSNNMLAMVLTPRQLARQVGGSVKCDSGSMVARATCLVVGAGGIVLDDGVHFHGEFSIMACTSAPGQVLNFGILAYITDYHDELRPLHGAMPVSNEPLAPPLLPGL